MATNTFATFGTAPNADFENYIQQKVLPLAIRQLVTYQFGDGLTLPKGRGTQYSAARYDRVNLPFQPLSEGVPPAGQTMNVTLVNATAVQWGDKITITDVADLTIKHPVFQIAIDLLSTQVSETLERNTNQALMAGTQINYVNKRGSRVALQAGDVLSPVEITRAVSNMFTLGAPRFMGDERRDMKIAADRRSDPSKSPSTMPHYVAVGHPLPFSDLLVNQTIQTAWSYSDINRLYNSEVGEWGGVRFCQSNMIPYFTGHAAVVGTAHDTGGALTVGNYYLIVTGGPATTSYEQEIYAATGALAVGAVTTGSVTFTTPNIPGYVFNAYLDGNASPVHLGLSTSGPTTGPMAGQAVQLPPNTSITITGVGMALSPPATPNVGVTVFPTFIFGRNAYGIVMLDNVKFFYLKNAEKSDPANQLRMIAWKIFYGTIILNTQFFMRIESTSAFTGGFV